MRSRLLSIVCTYLTTFMTGLHGFGSNFKILASSVLILHFVIFSLENYIHSRLSGKSLTIWQATSLLVVLVIFYIIEYSFLKSVTSTFAPWISLSFVFILILLYSSAKNYISATSISQYLVVTFSTIIFFHSFYL
jgi:hypothetical protein